MISDFDHLFMCLLAIYIYLLWRNIYSSPLTIFEARRLVFNVSFRSLFLMYSKF